MAREKTIFLFFVHLIGNLDIPLYDVCDMNIMVIMMDVKNETAKLNPRQREALLRFVGLLFDYLTNALTTSGSLETAQLPRGRHQSKWQGLPV
jgi:hypothetical protein